MGRLRSDVFEWFDAGRVVPGAEREVLGAAGMIPTGAEWRTFLGQLALWLGTLALAAAVIFFFAFNWDDLGRFAKLGIVESAIVAGLLVFWPLDLDGMAGKALLLLLSLLVGALLALTGQIYQTGSDAFELFAYWAVLILPWVLVARFSPLWLLWLALLNMAAYLYWQLSWDAEALIWTLFGLNTLALALWETAHRRRLSWLRDTWPPRLVALASGTMATALIISAITVSDVLAPLAVAAYAAWLGALYYWYRHVRPDLFMLAGGVLSATVAVATFLSWQILDLGSGGLLVIGLVVIAMSGGGAVWLQRIAREQPA
ncbi:MAG TPA: DUF2157 domain-containing protein [Allosphingosinicella sp.]|jgi:uncharacterized membrane protein